MKILGMLTRKEPVIILSDYKCCYAKNDMSRQDFENSSVQIELNKEYEHDKIFRTISIFRL